MNFDIRDYGACGDGKTPDTSAVQKAIDAACQAGGGRVVCGPGSFLVGTLWLKSNVELYLQAGCRLLGSTDLNDYEDFSAEGMRHESVPENTTKTLIAAAYQENISITGPGKIDGAGAAFYDTGNMRGKFYSKPSTPRPRMVMFFGCRDVRFEETSFIDSPCWTFWLMKCERVFIDKIRVTGDQRMINNDGIDIDSCRDVTVSNSVLRTGDDSIIVRSIKKMFEEPAACESVTITNCTLDSWCQGIRVGCPEDGEIRNIVFSNIVIHGTRGILFQNPKRYLREGHTGSADIHDVMFSNITIESQAEPVSLSIEQGVELKRLCDLTFSNLRIKSGKPCTVMGSDKTLISDVRFDNMDIATTGEQAIVCRYCRGIMCSNVQLSNIPEQEL